MAERRALATAINTIPNADPEAVRAFIKQEPLGEPLREKVVPEPVAKPTGQESLPVKSVQPLNRSTPTASGKRPEHASYRAGTIAMTFRFQPELAGALKRASLERELAGEPVYTQQDIVAQLLEPWLQELGYL